MLYRLQFLTSSNLVPIRSSTKSDSSLLLFQVYLFQTIESFKSLLKRIKMRLNLGLMLLLILQAVQAQSVQQCIQKLGYAKACLYYRFQGDCQPYQLQFCRPIRITVHDHRCPLYICVSLSIFCACYQLLPLINKKFFLNAFSLVNNNNEQSTSYCSIYDFFTFFSSKQFVTFKSKIKFLTWTGILFSSEFISLLLQQI